MIIGGRYGSVDAEGVSFTEREYDYAVTRKIPVLAFLHSDPDAIPAGKTELEPTALARLDALRAKAEQRMCKHWRTPEELGGVVSRSLVQLMKLDPGEGWVRARSASNAEEIQKVRLKIDGLTASLEAARTEPPEDAKNLAQGSHVFRVRCKVDVSERVAKLAWDSIFACLGPTMFDEASESDLEHTLEGKIAARCRRRAMASCCSRRGLSDDQGSIAGSWADPEKCQEALVEGHRHLLGSDSLRRTLRDCAQGDSEQPGRLTTGCSGRSASRPAAEPER